MTLVFKDYYSIMPTTTSSPISHATHIYPYPTPFGRNMDSINTTMGRASGTKISFSDIIAANATRKTAVYNLQRLTVYMYQDFYAGNIIGVLNSSAALNLTNFVSGTSYGVNNNDSLTSLKVPPYVSITLWVNNPHGASDVYIKFNGYSSSLLLNRELRDTDYFNIPDLRNFSKNSSLIYYAGDTLPTTNVSNNWDNCVSSFVIDANPTLY